MGKSCFFIGHRDASSEIEEELKKAVEEMIQTDGVVIFFVGQYGNFDYMAARAVMEMKKKYDEIRLDFVIPYHPAKRLVSRPEGFDGIFYPLDKAVLPRYAIVKANRRMIDLCDCMIVYVRRPGKSRVFWNMPKKQSARER